MVVTVKNAKMENIIMGIQIENLCEKPIYVNFFIKIVYII